MESMTTARDLNGWNLDPVGAYGRMVDSGELYGTLLYANGSYWWSPEYWVSPADGREAQRGAWVHLGSRGWFGDELSKERYGGALRVIPSDAFPRSPGEWSDLRDWT